MHPIRYIALFDSPTPEIKEICPFLTGDINPRVLIGTMKNENCQYFVYVHTETLNSTFTKQDVIVYFYLCSNFQEIAMPNDEY